MKGDIFMDEYENDKEENLADYNDYLYDKAKDDRIMCESKEEALKLHNEYPDLDRFLSKEYQEYVNANKQK